MKQFEIVSLDMFQTLVNVNSRTEQIWKAILHHSYTDESAQECARLLLDGYFEHSIKLKDTREFYLTKEVYGRSFEGVFRQMNMSYDLEAAISILFQEHVLSEFYSDTLPFLDRIIKKYTTCIVSDADEAMVPRFYTDYGIHAFISEHYQSYKNDDKNTMFKQLLKHYNTDPQKVIHIGDSLSDVAGAKREGITACWLNRDNKIWQGEVEPDFIIESLAELEDIIS